MPDRRGRRGICQTGRRVSLRPHNPSAGKGRVLTERLSLILLSATETREKPWRERFGLCDAPETRESSNVNVSASVAHRRHYESLSVSIEAFPAHGSVQGRTQGPKFLDGIRSDRHSKTQLLLIIKRLQNGFALYGAKPFRNSLTNIDNR